MFDETGGLGLVKETGIYDIPDDKNKEQENRVVGQFEIKKLDRKDFL